MIGTAVGHGFVVARDFCARVLLRVGVTPNMLSLAGLVIIAGIGVCYALGAGATKPAWCWTPLSDANVYLLLAAGLMILSAACDMLDGAVARIGNLASRFGAFLDSTLDRFADFVVFTGIAVYYAWAAPANITFILLAALAMFNGYMIAYTRARAEDIIPECTVGYWQRGERIAAILIATYAHNIPALLVQQAFLPLMTVLRRVFYTKAVIDGKEPVTDPRKGGVWLRIQLWKYPRATWAYDIVTGINILWLIFAPVPTCDPIRQWAGL
jgi:CDP-diacylglycerol--glycerol-3-phosphate 3-phosphatidyltransferase